MPDLPANPRHRNTARGEHRLTRPLGRRPSRAGPTHPACKRHDGETTLISPTPAAELAVVTITTAALAEIGQHIGTAPDDLETGGLLLGHEHRTGVDITFAAGPGPNAVHAPAHFRRDLPHAQNLAELAYRCDRALWVGEWHTHPHGPTHPSPRDVTTYRSFLSDPELDFGIVVALIVHPDSRASPAPAQERAQSSKGSPEPVEPQRDGAVRAWVIDSRTITATPLHVIPGPAAT